MAKAKKKVSGDAAGTPSAALAQSAPAPAAAPQRDGSRQARRELDDDLRAAQAKEAEDALRRAKAWQRAIVTLEGLLADSAWLEGRNKRRVWSLDPEQQADTVAFFEHWLKQAANRIALHVDGRREGESSRFVILLTEARLTLGDKAPSEALGRWSYRCAVDLAETLKALRVLLNADRNLADPLTPEESGYLKLLRDLADGDTLSDEIAATRIGYADPGSMVDLRKSLRKKGWNAIASKTGRGGGSYLDRSLLTPAQRERLVAL